jgi:glycosyltransferase involved in cell wall biosynthesis
MVRHVVSANRAGRPRFLLTFLAWASGLSGGDRHLLEVAARWQEHVDIAVLAPPQAFPTIRTFLGDVQTHAQGLKTGMGAILAAEYVRRAAVTAVRRLPSHDVVVAASHFSPDAVALTRLVSQGAFGAGYIYHLVEGRSGLHPRTLWSKADERVGLALLRRSAGLVFVSNEKTDRALARRGFEPVRTSVGVDLSTLRQASPTELPPRAAFVARLSRSKGVADAIRAWSLVHKALPKATLRMVGAGPERESGTALAEKLGVADEIEWLGFVSDEEKHRILSDSRLLLAPSYEEGWGISVCEALGSGVPVVAYQLPVLDELFGSAYLSAPKGDVTALADLAVQVLTDDSLAARHASAGRKAAQRYDVSRVAEQELEKILSACGS